MNLTFDNPVLVVGGAAFGDDLWDQARAITQNVVAADGGADHVLQRGAVPDWVIGDLDSISDTAKALCKDRILHIREQDSTDFEKVISRLYAPLIVGVGFLGARIDHQMAVQSALGFVPHQRVLLIGDHDILFLCPPEISLDLEAGTRVSLYPLAPVQIESTGLVWPTDGISMAPDAQIGTSNRAQGPITLRPNCAKALVILPRDVLGQCVHALRCAPRWNVRDI